MSTCSCFVCADAEARRAREDLALAIWNGEYVSKLDPARTDPRAMARAVLEPCPAEHEGRRPGGAT